MDTSKTKVLVVEDDPAQLRLMTAMLEKDGYLVYQAQDGHEALSAIEANCPHFLITDWEMPNMNGVELCRRVRQLKLENYVYIVFVTGRTDGTDVIEALEAGADDYVTKPVKRAELAARLSSGRRVVELEQRLQHLAKSDPLTGLPTKRTFLEQFKKEWQRAQRHRIPLSCMVFDIDFFKQINDSRGHPAGDAVLKAVSQVLDSTCRISDSICRFGGDEFCALLPETNEEQAAIWADRLRKKIAQLEFPFDIKNDHITASLGVAERVDGMADPDELFEHADQALLVAKQAGRDQVVRYSNVGSEGDQPTGRVIAGNANDPFDGVLARHAMTTLVASLRDDDPLPVAARLLVSMRQPSAPVVDENRQLVGILSQRDLLAAMHTPKAWNRTVSEAMTKNVVTYEEVTPVKTIYDFLNRVALRQVVIVNDGRPVGVVSRDGLVRWFGHWFEAHVDGSSGVASLPAELSHCALNLREIAQQTVGQATLFQKRLELGASHDLLQEVVSSASRLQELSNDLLACSTLINQADVGTQTVDV